MHESQAVLTLPTDQAISTLEGQVSSYFASDRNGSLFMLHADEGAIYKVGYLLGAALH